MSFALSVAVTAHRQASLDAQVPISNAQLAHAVVNSVKARSGRYGWRNTLYRDTLQRASWRALFDAAYGLPDTLVAVTYIKDMGQLRTMLAQPLQPDADCTRRYVTVWDTELGAYRRVNLDGIVKITLETGAMQAQYPMPKNH